jgi:hypothetical protein
MVGRFGLELFFFNSAVAQTTPKNCYTRKDKTGHI